MNRSEKISGLPRSKFSLRDVFLLNLSTESVKKEDYNCRLTQQERAYKKNEYGYFPHDH